MTQETKSPQSEGITAEKKQDTQEATPQGMNDAFAWQPDAPQASTAPPAPSTEKVDFSGAHGTAPIHLAPQAHAVNNGQAKQPKPTTVPSMETSVEIPTQAPAQEVSSMQTSSPIAATSPASFASPASTPETTASATATSVAAPSSAFAQPTPVTGHGTLGAMEATEDRGDGGIKGNEEHAVESPLSLHPQQHVPQSTPQHAAEAMPNAAMPSDQVTAQYAGQAFGQTADHPYAQASNQEAQAQAGQMQDGQAQEEQAEQAEATPDIPMGFAAKTFQHMAKLGPIYLCVFFTLHMLSALMYPSIFYSMELHYLEIFHKMQQAGQWLIPPTHDVLGATFPGYYWFMALVQHIPAPEALFLPILSSLTAFIALCGVYTLGRCCRLENNGAFGGLLLLLSCPLFLIFLHLIGPELLTAGFFCFALALIFRGLTRESAPFSFIFGFIFTALATFTGGFLPLWTVLIASILLVLWRLDIHRAQKLDAVVGFGCMVLLFAAWLVVVILVSQEAKTLDDLMKQAITPFMPPYWPVPMPWTLAFLAIGLVPWICAPLFSPWFSVMATSFKSLKASRKENSGPTWLYLVTLVGIALITLQKQDTLLTALPLLPILGLILGATICNFSKFGSNVFFLLLALLLLICGALLTFISIPATAAHWTGYVSKYTSENISTILQTLPGLPILSGLCILTAALLIKFTQRQWAQGPLLVMAIFSLLAVQPFFIFVAPSLVGPQAKYHTWDSGLGTMLLPNSFPKTKAEHTVGQPLKQNKAPATPAATAPQTPVPASPAPTLSPAIPATPAVPAVPVTPPPTAPAPATPVIPATPDATMPNTSGPSTPAPTTSGQNPEIPTSVAPSPTVPLAVSAIPEIPATAPTLEGNSTNLVRSPLPATYPTATTSTGVPLAAPAAP